MANIQTRLRQQRYSEIDIRLPSYNQLKQLGLNTSKTFTNKYGGKNGLLTSLSTKVISNYSNPSHKDKHYKTNHKQIVDDYLLYANNNIKHYRYLVLNKLIIQLAYYILNKDTIDFKYYCISWYNNVLWQMRKYIIKIKYNNKIFDRVSPSSNMYYPLLKPMTNKTIEQLSYELYNILIDITLKYIEHHKL